MRLQLLHICVPSIQKRLSSKMQRWKQAKAQTTRLSHIPVTSLKMKLDHKQTKTLAYLNLVRLQEAWAQERKQDKKQGLRLCILASYMSKSGVSTALIFARHSCMRALVYIAIKLVLFRAANLDWYLELFFENIQMSDIWEMEVKGMGSLNIKPWDKKRTKKSFKDVKLENVGCKFLWCLCIVWKLL